VSSNFRARVLVAEDEEFTLSVLRDVLEGANFQVSVAKNVSSAIEQVNSFDPHAIITDLNFGINEPTGADLLNHVDKEHPWIGKVVLTSHASPALALPSGIELPEGVKYLVKSDLESISDLIQTVEQSISQTTVPSNAPVVENSRIVISATQGEILRLLADGYTNSAIARKRGTSLRAAETLIQRTFASLGLKSDEDFNPRILAVKLWHQGKVTVK
jgi:hypothetical protein